MRKVFAFALLIMFWSPAAVGAQSVGPVELVKIPKVQNPDVERNRCGDYFLLVENRMLIPPGTRIQLIAKGAVRSASFEILQSKYETIIGSQSVPTVEIVLRNPKALGVLDPTTQVPMMVLKPEDVRKVVIRINSSDYQGSLRCLPPPKPKT
jgi:hypothetical protein